MVRHSFSTRRCGICVFVDALRFARVWPFSLPSLSTPRPARLLPSPAPAPAQPFVKVQKNKAYFKRYQVKWRRRRCEYRAARG